MSYWDTLRIHGGRRTGLVARAAVLAALVALVVFTHPESLRHGVDLPLWLAAAAGAGVWAARLRRGLREVAWGGYYGAWMALASLVVHGQQSPEHTHWWGLYTVGALTAALELPTLPAFLGLGTWGLLTNLQAHLGHHATEMASPGFWVANGLVGIAFGMAVFGVRRLYALHKESLTDPLTGIGNRRALYQAVAAAWERARTKGGRFSLLLLDLDNFKSINDNLGHEAGDRVLQSFAKSMAEALRAYGTFCRYGGDEFAVTLLDTGAEEAAAVAERLRQRTAELADHQAGGIALTVSVGVAAYPDHGRTPQELIRSADRALLYGAKLGGRNRVALAVALPGLDGWEQIRQDLPAEALPLLVVMATVGGETADHVVRVAALGAEVGRVLQRDEEELRLLRQAAILHDVGKIAVPRRILDKPGPLSETERRQVRQHTELGAFMVANLGLDARVVEAVRHHHERWDGKGYPDGLSGEAIPILARILATVDAYDAMTMPRPYRPPRTPEEALEELRRCSGSQFDPRVVGAVWDVVTRSLPARYGSVIGNPRAARGL